MIKYFSNNFSIKRKKSVLRTLSVDNNDNDQVENGYVIC